jgi:peptide/nickel transport system ATP-binding protein
MVIDNHSPSRDAAGFAPQNDQRQANGQQPDRGQQPGHGQRPDRGPAGEELLRIADLQVSVQGGTLGAVRGASLRIQPGEIVGLVGESGSGKTLTCRAALGVLPDGCTITGGSVLFGDRDLLSLSRRQWERMHGSAISAVFQDPASYLNPSLTVGSQLCEVLRLKLGLRRKAAHARAIELFEAVGLRSPEHVFHQIPAELSGGMLQRVMIAIAISCDPQLLIADEATTALDVTIQAEVIELLLQLRADRGLAVLFVSHDLAVVTQLCDRIVVFYSGEVVESGFTDEIIERPRHPYTQALLRVASVGDFRRRELEVIAGQPPTVGADITGCRFADRCPVVIDACLVSAIKPVRVGRQHEVRCIRASDLTLGSARADSAPAAELVTR